MFLGDSRALEGPGIIPAQDHRPRIDVDARALQIAVRIVDRAQSQDLATHIHDEEVQGDVHGLSVWRPAGSSRPMAAWRHAWPCVVVNRGTGQDGVEAPPWGGHPTGPTTPGGPSDGGQSNGGTPGGGYSTPRGDIPPDSRTWGGQNRITLDDYASYLLMSAGYNRGWN